MITVGFPLWTSSGDDDVGGCPEGDHFELTLTNCRQSVGLGSPQGTLRRVQNIDVRRCECECDSER